MDPLQAIMSLLQAPQPKRPVSVRPDYGLTGAQVLQTQKSPYERTLRPGETRSAEDLQGMLAEVIMAAGSGALPGVGPSGQARQAPGRVRPGYEKQFKEWFGESKAVDRGGKPLDLFHGTASDFKAFKPQAGPSTSAIGDWPGIYLTPDRASASGIAQFESRLRGGNAAVMPVHASVKNPAEWGQYRTAAEAIRNGHDGRVVRDSQGNITEVLVFTPQQVKSAIGNKGTYSTSKEDIRE